MTTKLCDFLREHERTMHAVDAGTRMHVRLEHITVDDDGTLHGDADVIAQINANPDLKPFFAPTSRPEVPVAGIIANRFVSRRIDRVAIDDVARRVWILDYKTDVNPDAMRARYAAQIREYVDLMHRIYPTYAIGGYILWTHDWHLEQII